MFKKLSLFFTALSLLCATTVAAADGQTLVVNGETVAKTVTKITFSGDNVVLHFADTSTQEADMSTVVLSFSETSAIKELTTYSLRGLVGNSLNLSGLKAGTETAVYDAAGKLMLRSTASKLDVSNLRAGIYVLKAGNQIVKFVKR